MYQLIEVDPADLAAYPGNVREDLGDISHMVETMKEIGVVNPPIVAHVGDGTGTFKIIAGKRRTAAAIKAGLATIPVLVQMMETEESSYKIRSLIENVQRKDLTPVEEAEGWRQLALEGLDEKAIARVTGVGVDRVENGMRLAASPIAVAVVKKYDLTLEQALVLAEFDDHKEAVKELTATAVKEPHLFAHTASRIREDHNRAKARADAVEGLEAKKIKVVDEVGHSGLDGPRYLSQLKAKDGKKLTAANHKKCPGHAARVVVDHWTAKASIHYVCTAPAANGHKTAMTEHGGSKPAAGSKEAEKASAARRETLAFNKAWRAARPVRREFVKTLLTSTPSPDRANAILAYVAGEILGCPEDLAPMSRAKTEEMLTELTGVGPGKTSFSYSRSVGLAIVDKATSKTIACALLAQVAAVREVGMDPQGARPARSWLGRYLSFLKKQGYTLSDVEATQLAQAVNK